MKRFLFLTLLLFILSCKKNDSNISSELKFSDSVKLEAEIVELRDEVLSQIINTIEKSDDKQPAVYQIKHTPIYFYYDKHSDEPAPPPETAISVSHDSIFIKSDSLFYITQSMSLLTHNPDFKRINDKVQFVDYSFLKTIKNNFWEGFREKYGEKCITKISVPFFNKDKNYCIVNIGYQCDYLYGEGATYLYKKNNGIWEEVKSWDNWIS